jgi:hypothetical protein
MISRKEVVTTLIHLNKSAGISAGRNSNLIDVGDELS